MACKKTLIMVKSCFKNCRNVVSTKIIEDQHMVKGPTAIFGGQCSTQSTMQLKVMAS